VPLLAQDFKLKPAMFCLRQPGLRLDKRRAYFLESLAVPGVEARIVELRL
jgi:hypothetical protein